MTPPSLELQHAAGVVRQAEILRVTVSGAFYALWALVVACLSALVALELKYRRPDRAGRAAGTLPVVVVAFFGGLAPYLFAVGRTAINYATVAVLAYVAAVVTMEIVDELVRIEL